MRSSMDPPKFSGRERRSRSGSGSGSSHQRPGPSKLNTWDVPEFLPGALPRANSVQRAFFEERSKKVFEKNLFLEELDSEESKKKRESEDAVKLEQDIAKLREMFPSLDLNYIQESYLEMEGDIDGIVNRFLLVSESETFAVEQSIRPPSSNDVKEFPSLTPSSESKYIDKIRDSSS